MKDYSVYKHTAPNGKVYIGITSRNPVYRWNNGKGYQDQKKFYNAILKYGWDNIKHEIVYTGLTEEEAKEKEIELIAEHDSVENGYNASTGGETHSGAYKYKAGDVFGHFKIIGHADDGRKIVLLCTDCGKTLERHIGCIQKQCVKCKCENKRCYNPNPEPQRHITYKGKTQTGRAWAEELGINEGTIWSRYKKGKPIDAPVTVRRREAIICKTCGKAFKSADKNAKFCSIECSAENQRKTRPKAVCICCGKEFQVTRSINKNYRAMFCGVPCRVRYQKEKA